MKQQLSTPFSKSTDLKETGKYINLAFGGLILILMLIVLLVGGFFFY